MIAALVLLVAAADPQALEKFVRGVRADGPVQLPAAIQGEVLAQLPSSDCGEPATVAPEAYGVRDRGDGALVVAKITSCKGASLLALAPGTPLRVARLLELPEGATVRAVSAVALQGLREDALAVQLGNATGGAELRVLLRRDNGFGFSESGTLHDYAQAGDCAARADEGAGWAGFARGDGQRRLLVVRVDASCAGGPWRASCVVYGVERGDIAKSGVCALPAKLDEKSLRASGWR